MNNDIFAFNLTIHATFSHTLAGILTPIVIYIHLQLYLKLLQDEKKIMQPFALDRNTPT